MLGQGSIQKKIKIGPIRELNESELVALREPRGKVSAVQKFRDSHRKVAWLFASGMTVAQVAEASCYSYSRVASLHCTPAFQQLIAELREKIDERRVETLDDFEELVHKNMMVAERMIADKLEEADEDNEFLPTRELIAISRDAADRLGYGKKATNVNVNVDFAAQLDRAISRSSKVKVIEHLPSASLTPPLQIGSGAALSQDAQRRAGQPHQSVIRRRVA